VKQKKKYTAEKKAIILRELLDNQVSTSQLSEQYGVNINSILQWKKQLFEGAAEILGRKNKKQDNELEKKTKLLEEKLKRKDEVISLIAQENIELKKNINGEI
jgi:transposase-like protein